MTMNLTEEIGEAAALELLAEECAELAHACLKLARIRRGENPTNAGEQATTRSVIEEIADVTICTDAIRDCDWYDTDFEFIVSRWKGRRMRERLDSKRRASDSIQNEMQDQPPAEAN